ncbi:hypothetical protein SAMN04515674_101573 [Pseudarcicella hirudinis]|uniref:Uncharacterized protein n=2 Tax=Pseudarcicella hirudinis TaxID=1079859 RepID=A0A1I5N3C5_9BACT|nr:hypothetical protein SAMN04515674_101573 [Pseudarcicella hirudinis]
MPFLAVHLLFNWVESKLDDYLQRKNKLNEGDLALSERRFEDALSFFKEQVLKSPKSAVFYQKRGKANFGLKNYYSALYDFEQSIMFDNTIGETYLLKGKALYKIDEFDRAFVEFDKADWHFRGENAEALRWRGMARYYINQEENARMDFQKAVELGDEASLYILRNKFGETENA